MISSHLATTLLAARRAVREGDLDTALGQTASLMRRFSTPPFPVKLPGGVPEIDDLLQCLAGRLTKDFAPRRPAQEGGDWALATCLYETGGHTPLIRDLHEALPAGLGGLVLTLVNQDARRSTPQAARRTGLAPDRVHSAEGPTPGAKLRHVLEIFSPAPPRRLFLLQHPDDTASVAAAALLQAAGTEIWFLHHSDGLPTAGLFLPGARIIDFTPRACAFSRSVSGLKSTWLPLSCPDPGALPAGPFPRSGRLVTALSGSQFKTSQDSACAYVDVIAALFRGGADQHVHIGPLDEAQLSSIRDALEAEGVDGGRFRHVPLAPTLVEALTGHQVDLLLNTWPTGGARATVEAMAAGVPVLWRSPHESMDRLSLQMAYPEAECWRTPADLTGILRRADASWLSAQSHAAYRHYQATHHPSLWSAFFSDPAGAPRRDLPAGFDHTLFVSSWWNTVLELAIETRVDRTEEVRDRLKRQEGRLEGIAQLKQGLDRLEKESRYPWLVRLLRRWRRSPKPPGRP